jgi:hypothetical protein
MVNSNQMLARYLGELGINGAVINSTGTALYKIGGNITCAIGTNTYECSFPGFKVTPDVFVQSYDSLKKVDITSKSTSTVTLRPYTICDGTTTTNGGTATAAEFALMVMGASYL